MKTKDTESEILKAAEQEFYVERIRWGKDYFDRACSRRDTRHVALLFQNEGTVVRAYSYRESTIDERVGFGCFRSTGIALGAAERRSVTCHFDFIAAAITRFINEVFSVLMSDKIVKVADCLMKGIQQELDELHAQGKVEWVDVRMLLLDIISLNVFSVYCLSDYRAYIGRYCCRSESLFLNCVRLRILK